MIEYNNKQSKEIYNALLDSKVDLMEYFLGADPKKTDYYKKSVRRKIPFKRFLRWHFVMYAGTLTTHMIILKY